MLTPERLEIILRDQRVGDGDWVDIDVEHDGLGLDGRWRLGAFIEKVTEAVLEEYVAELVPLFRALDREEATAIQHGIDLGSRRAELAGIVQSMGVKL
jgi:hypothetical protein